MEEERRVLLPDAHCHLDFAANGRLLAHAAECARLEAFSTTVTPAGYERARALFASCATVRVGVGLHPWWVADGSCGEAEISRFEELAKGARFIGEIGLDFGRHRATSRDEQTAAFERAVRAGITGGKVVSLHAVAAADEVLDVLERDGCTSDNVCIMHWFSGSSDAVQRAVRLGCYFSVGPRMLATKRGRAYAQAIPADRLLVETDWPSSPCGEADFAAWTAQLQEAADALVALKGADILERIVQTWHGLFDAPVPKEAREEGLPCRS